MTVPRQVPSAMQCKRCNIVKPAQAFTPDLRMRAGLRSWCRQCVALYNRDWRRESARSTHAGKRVECTQCGEPLAPAPGRKYIMQICRTCAPDVRFRSMVKRYGVDKQMFEAMYLDQDGKCAIMSCLREAKAIDHDHVTGRVRGLLCLGCNVAVGFLESVTWMAAARDYLADGRWPGYVTPADLAQLLESEKP